MKQFPSISKTDSNNSVPSLKYCMYEKITPESLSISYEVLHVSNRHHYVSKIQMEYTGKGIEMAIFRFAVLLAADFTIGSSLSTRF